MKNKKIEKKTERNQKKKNEGNTTLLATFSADLTKMRRPDSIEVKAVSNSTDLGGMKRSDSVKKGDEKKSEKK